MSVIVNIRSTNGGGKTTAVTQYMKTIRVAEELKVSGRTWAYRLQNGVFVLGRYITACGGCDTIRTFAEVKAGVTELSSQGPVLFESLLWSTCFRPSAELAESLPTHHFIFAKLDTPADECLRRVLARRRQAGNEKPFNPTKLQLKHLTIETAQRRLEAAGFDTRILPHAHPLIALAEWLCTLSEQTPALMHKYDPIKATDLDSEFANH
jgi:hypothetical protein